MSTRMEGKFVNQTILGVLIGIGCAGGVGLIVLAWKAAQAIATAAEGLQTAITENTAAIRDMNSKISPLMEQLQGHLEAMPGLMKAITRIGEAQLEIYNAQFAGLNGASNNHQQRTKAPSRDVDSANAEYEISQMMRYEGISREEAMSRMNSANNRGPWATIFDDWKTEGAR